MIIVATVIFIVAFLTVAITIPMASWEYGSNKRSHDEVERKLLESCPEYREYKKICSTYWEE